MTTDPVLRARRGAVEIVTINRPEARNAINYETSAALADAFDEIEADDDVWAVVLTGAGDKAFCAGMDLKAFAGGGGNVMGVSGGFAGITTRDFPKALIAACNGHALAGGFEIMLACDLVVAADHATFGIPEVKRGLVAGAGGAIRLAKRISLARALELGMTGDAVDAQTVHQLGLVNRVVPASKVLDTAGRAGRADLRGGAAGRPGHQEGHQGLPRGAGVRGVGDPGRRGRRGVPLARRHRGRHRLRREADAELDRSPARAVITRALAAETTRRRGDRPSRPPAHRWRAAPARELGTEEPRPREDAAVEGARHRSADEPVLTLMSDTTMMRLRRGQPRRTS